MVIQEHLQTLNLLCLVLGMDFKQTVNEFHPTLGDPEGPFTLTSESIETLAAAITNLREVKLRRMQRVLPQIYISVDNNLKPICLELAAITPFLGSSKILLQLCWSFGI